MYCEGLCGFSYNTNFIARCVKHKQANQMLILLSPITMYLSTGCCRSPEERHPRTLQLSGATVYLTLSLPSFLPSRLAYFLRSRNTDIFLPLKYVNPTLLFSPTLTFFYQYYFLFACLYPPAAQMFCFKRVEASLPLTRGKGAFMTGGKRRHGG